MFSTLNHTPETSETNPSRKASQITCPGCGYRGHGFMYVEFQPTAFAIVPRRGASPLVKLDRPGEIQLDGTYPDQIECPECRGRFAVPESLTLEFTERKA